MLKHYCNQCGQPTEYSLTLPKFCANCGQSFAKIGQTDPIPQRQLPQKKILPIVAKSQIANNIEDEDYEVNTDLINGLTQLEMEAEISDNRKKITIGSIAGTAKVAIPIKPGGKINKKKILQEFKDEASQTKGSITIGGEI